MEKHYGEMATHQREQIAVARGNLALLQDRHGKGSPEYKKAAAQVKSDEDYFKGMGDLAEMMDKGEEPNKIAAKANDLGMQHADKMPKIKVSDGNGNIREEIVNPLTERVKPYAAKYAAAKTEEARQKYGIDSGIQAVATNSGQIKWISPRTPGGGKIGYPTLEELVKEESIKPRKPARGLTPASIQFPYEPSGGSSRGASLGYPYNTPMSEK
jgi:hypothetical protein